MIGQASSWKIAHGIVTESAAAPVSRSVVSVSVRRAYEYRPESSPLAGF
jgi:hypothetical protein